MLKTKYFYETSLPLVSQQINLFIEEGNYKLEGVCYNTLKGNDSANDFRHFALITYDVIEVDGKLKDFFPKKYDEKNP